MPVRWKRTSCHNRVIVLIITIIPYPQYVFPFARKIPCSDNSFCRSIHPKHNQIHPRELRKRGYIGFRCPCRKR